MPADLLVASMAAELISSTYLQRHWWDTNGRPLAPSANTQLTELGYLTVLSQKCILLHGAITIGKHNICNVKCRTFEFSRNTQSWPCWHFDCLNMLDSSWIEKLTTSILIQIIMTNLNLLLKVTRISTISNLFPLEVVQKCQHCQLCAGKVSKLQTAK